MTVADPAEPLRLLLRDATRPVHMRLHRHPLLRCLTRQSVTRPGYVRAVSALFGYYRPAERRLGTFAGPRTPRTPLLGADLAALGLAGPTIAALPCADEVPRLETEAMGFGCRYVLDGASNGGRAMVPGLIRRLGITADAGASFFAGAGFDAAAEWTLFLDGLDRLDDSAARAEAVEGALLTFLALERWLDAACERWEDGCA